MVAPEVAHSVTARNVSVIGPGCTGLTRERLSRHATASHSTPKIRLSEVLSWRRGNAVDGGLVPDRLADPIIYAPVSAFHAIRFTLGS